MTYKKTYGYQPGIASIDNLPVCIKGRNGNSPAKYLQDKTLERSFSNVHDSGIKVGLVQSRFGILSEKGNRLGGKLR